MVLVNHTNQVLRATVNATAVGEKHDNPHLLAVVTTAARVAIETMSVLVSHPES